MSTQRTPNQRKALVKHAFQTMSTCDTLAVAIPLYKLVRAEVKNYKIQRKEVFTWCKASDIAVLDCYCEGLASTGFDYYLQGACGSSKGGSWFLSSNLGYSSIMYQLAYRILAHRFGLTMRQIHEIEAFSYPSVSGVIVR